jgi:hypothetical protein
MENQMALSVIGAGLGRTGTLSLKLALERLGFDRCYHMKEVFEHLDHVPVWDKAADGEAVDWDALFNGYRSAVDFPAASFHRELADRYPDARIILTVRNPDTWYQSASETILRALDGPLPDHLTAWGEMARKTVVDRAFGGNPTGRDHLIACYERHNEEVRRTYSPDRLLVYEVSEGWEPLCQFLKVSVPDEPFPRVNTTDEFREHIAPLLRA